MTKRFWFSFLLCHLILFNKGSGTGQKDGSDAKEPKTTGSPVTKITIKTTSLPGTTTTQQPIKEALHDEKQEHSEVRLSQRESLEKPLPKMRGVEDHSQPGSFDETEYDTNEDTVPDESFSDSRSGFQEKPFYKYSDSAFTDDSTYFETEGRSKRTAELDDLYSRPQEHEIELTPEEMMALLSILEETRAYSEGHGSLFPYYENTVSSIEDDMRDEDDYRDRVGNTFGGYDNGFDYYPTGLRSYLMGRRRRSSHFGHMRPGVPVFRRAVL